MAKELPKVGDRIPVEKFHVSKMNMRWEEPFGEAEEDKLLIANLKAGEIIGPFKARPEGEGFGVVVGRRRFLAKKETGVKEFVVGGDCLIEDMTDEGARDSSIIENLPILRREPDPIIRAKRLSEAVAFSPTGLRGTARRWGIPASTLSEWLQVLQLTPKMQESVSKGLVSFSDALTVARMKFGEEKQDKLADVLETEGLEGFKKELARVTAGQRKRGIPAGVYTVIRAVFDTRYAPDVETVEKLDKLAEAKGMDRDKYSKWVLSEHVKSA